MLSARLSQRTAYFFAAVVGVLFISSIFPVDAFAQAADKWPAEKMLPAAIGWFDKLGEAIRNKFHPTDPSGRVVFDGNLSWAEAVFLFCAAVQGAVFLLISVLRQTTSRTGGPVKLGFKMLRFVIFVAVAGGLLQYNYKITEKMEDIFITQMAPEVTNIGGAGFNGFGPAGTPQNAAEVIKVGWSVSSNIYSNASIIFHPESITQGDSTQAGAGDAEKVAYDPDGWGSWISTNIAEAATGMNTTLQAVSGLVEFVFSPDMWLAAIIWLVTLIAFYAIAFQVVTARIVLALVSAFVPLFLAFTPLRVAQPLVSGFIRYWLYAFIKLTAIYLFLPALMILPLIAQEVLSGTNNVVIAGTVDAINSFQNLTDSYFSNDYPFSVGWKDVSMDNMWARLDGMLIVGGLAVVAAAVVKIVPTRFAEFSTQGFSLEPLYDLYD